MDVEDDQHKRDQTIPRTAYRMAASCTTQAHRIIISADMFVLANAFTGDPRVKNKNDFGLKA